jgi:ZIP family zinc transporter
MNQLVVIAVFSWLAGFASFVGGAFASLGGPVKSEAKREFIHGVVAFGGGTLVAAVAFALVPKGIADLPTLWLATTFCLGGVAFCRFDAYLSRRGGSKAQFMAMLMDFVPEALAMGALFAHDHKTGILLALFIGAQNLPEGFNAFRESVAEHVTPRATLRGLLAVSFLGPVCGCIGYIFLQERPVLTASIMSFAAGGILYLVFQDIAPQSKMQRHWAPPLGAVLGFAVGMVSNQLLS